jgi:hypothetical protein
MMDIYRLSELQVTFMRSILVSVTLLFSGLLALNLHSQELSSSELGRFKWTKLTTLELKESEVGHGQLQIGRLISDGKPMRVRGTPVRDGFFAHAPSRLVFDIKDKGYKALKGRAGLEDIHEGSVKFKILGDGKELWQSEDVVIQNGRAKIVRFALNIEGVSELVLSVEDLGRNWYDHSVWIEPEIGK